MYRAGGSIATRMNFFLDSAPGRFWQFSANHLDDFVGQHRAVGKTLLERTILRRAIEEASGEIVAGGRGVDHLRAALGWNKRHLFASAGIGAALAHFDHCRFANRCQLLKGRPLARVP